MLLNWGGALNVLAGSRNTRAGLKRQLEYDQYVNYVHRSWCNALHVALSSTECCSVIRVQGSLVRDQSSEFRAQRYVWFMVHGSGFGVQRSGLRAYWE